MIDSHRFGSFECSAPASGRYVRSFSYARPQQTAGFRQHLLSGKKRETYAGEPYADAVTHKLGLLFEDDTTLPATINATLLAIVPGVTWTFTEDGSATPYSCRVLDVTHSETYKASDGGRTFAAIDFDITCTPGWEKSERDITPSTQPTTLPAALVIADVGGSMPARFRSLLTFDQATTSQYVGLRHEAPAGAAFVQDYQGTADTDALSDQAATGTMDADGTALGTPSTLSTTAMDGWYLAVARVEQSDATPGDTTYFATSTVTGSNMSESGSFTTAAVPATVAGAYERVVLGPLPVPAEPVPDIDTGSGWAAEAISDQQTTHDADTEARGATYLNVGQTVALTAGEKVTGFTFRTGAEGAEGGAVVYVSTVDGSDLPTETILTYGMIAGPVAANTDARVNLDWIAPTSANYAFFLTITDAATVRLNTAGGYASGQAVHYSGGAWSAIAGDDLYFKVYTQAPLGFNSTVGISAANAGAGTAKLDTVALLPYDEFALIAAASMGADEGLLIDAARNDTSVTVYAASKAGGIGPLDQGAVDWEGSPHLWPGDTTFVIDGGTPDDPATGADLIVSVTERYLTPYGG